MAEKNTQFDIEDLKAPLLAAVGAADRAIEPGQARAGDSEHRAWRPRRMPLPAAQNFAT